MSSTNTSKPTGSQPEKVQKPTIPVKYEFMGSLRRTSIEVPPRFNQLRRKLAASFPQFAHLFNDKDQVLHLIYVDDEGDECTITSSDELAAAYRLAHKAGKVLRFTVPAFDSDQPTRVQNVPALPAPAQNQRENKKAERKAAIKAQRQAEKAERQAAKKAEREAASVAFASASASVGPVMHVGVTCDATGQNPIVGPRFHLRNANYDICQSAFDKLPQEMQQKFDRIDTPTRMVDWQPASASEIPAIHWNITCDKSGQEPIIGKRFWKRGFNYDLCEAEFNKLPEDEKAQYLCLAEPVKGPQFFGRGRNFFGGFGGGFHHGRCHPHHHGPGHNGPGHNGQRRHRGRYHHGPAHFFKHMQQHMQQHPAFQQMKQEWRKHHGKHGRVEFVEDVSIPDGSYVPAGSPFIKQWKLRASGGPIQAGTNLVFVGGEKFAAPDTVPVNQGQEVPADEEFKVAVPMVAPSKDGKFRSFWRLQNASGRRFGPRVWAQVSTTPVAAEPAKQEQPYEELDMTFDSDITVPDGATIDCGASIRKIWRLNSTTGWGEGVQLRCVDTEGPYAGFSEAVPIVPKDAQFDLEITVTAPSEANVHIRSHWRLFRDETPFGHKLWFDFVTGSVADDVESKQDAEDAEASDSSEASGGAKEESTEKESTPAQSSNQPNLLQQILAGINVVEPSQRAAMSDLLFKGLKSGDFAAVMQALAQSNIHLE
jgi:hypothetical protein